MSRAQLTSTVEQNSAGAAAPWVAGKNALINGGFDWWQRGTSFSGTGYGVDRWSNSTVYANVTVSQQSSGAPSGSLYYMRFTSTGAGSFTNMYQYLESATAAMLWGQTVTFSIKMRRNSTLNNSGMYLGVDKSSTIDAGSGATWTSLGTASVPLASIPTGTGSTNWYTATFTVAIPNDGTAQSLRFYIGYSGTAPSGSVVDIAQAQVEIGSVATPFSRAGGTLQGELALCQRYLPVLQGGGDVYTGYAYGTNAVVYSLALPVTARVAPTGITLAGSGTYLGWGLNTSYSITPLFNTGAQNSITVYAGSGPTITAGQGSRFTIPGGAAILATGCEL
jgi:hypothetical protein